MSNLFFNPYKQFTGLFIPDWLLNLDCSMSSKFIYGTMAYYAGDKGIYNHGHDTIANKIGASEKTVRRGLQELIELHLIFRQQVGLNQNNRYYFIYRPQIMGINVTTDFGLDKLSDQERTHLIEAVKLSGQEWSELSGPSYSKEILDTSTTSSTEDLIQINEDPRKVIDHWEQTLSTKSEHSDTKRMQYIIKAVHDIGVEKLKKAISNRSKTEFYINNPKPRLRTKPYNLLGWPETIENALGRNRKVQNNQNLPKRGTANHPESTPSNISNFQFELSKSDPEQISKFLSTPHPLNKKLLKFYES